MSLRDEFQKLKLAIVGTKTTQIDQKLDQAVSDITTFRAKSGRNGYIDMVRSLIAQSTTGFDIDLSSRSGLSSHGTSPAMFGQGLRLARYRTYQSIISNINYSYRALEVLTDNIISPDDITKASLEIKSAQLEDNEDATNDKTIHVKDTVKKLKLEEYLSLIVRNTLLFGDFFVEIAEGKKALTSKAYLAESDYDRELGRKETFHVEDVTIMMDYSMFLESPFLKEEEVELTEAPKEIKGINKIVLAFHEPDNVVKLQSELFPLCFGYLIFPKTTYMPQFAMKDQGVNEICASIIKSLAKKIPQIKEFNQKELKDMLSVMVTSLGDQSKMMNIRYIPPDRMQHFMRPSTKYYPYGESIFDSTQYASKVLVAMETALAVQRLARSTEKRKIAVEIGLPRDARKMVEKMKEEFRKRKVSLDSFGSIDTIPSMITTFEDIYVPQKDGKPFVDVSTFSEGNVDVRGKVDELKFLRDSSVASLGVPPSFLNIEENVNAKSTLAEENILFARTIIGHQKYLTHDIVDLLQKVYDLVYPEEALEILDNVLVALPQPKSLQFEREARYISELANLIETLERIGIPKEYTKKKYLTSVDWEDMKNYEIDGKIETAIGTTKDEEGLGGGMGGMGGIGTGSF